MGANAGSVAPKLLPRAAVRARAAHVARRGAAAVAPAAGRSSEVPTHVTPATTPGSTGPASQEEVPYGWPALQPPFLYDASAEAALSDAQPTGLPPLWRMLLLSDGSVTRHLQLLSGSPVVVDCLSMGPVGHSTAGFPPGVDLVPGPRVQRQVLLRAAPRRPPAQAAAAPEGRLAQASASTGPAATTGGGPAARGAQAGHGRGERGSGGSGKDEEAGPDGAGGQHPDAPHGVPLVYASSWWSEAEVGRYLKDTSQPIWTSLSRGRTELYREVHSLTRGHSAELEALLGVAGPFWGRQYTFWSGGRPLTVIVEVFSPRLAEWLGPADAAAEAAAGSAGTDPFGPCAR